MPPETCPHCGASVPPGAKACPECGSDDETGWSDQAHAQQLDLPDRDFDYDRFVKEEFGAGDSSRKRFHWVWWIAMALLLIALTAIVLSR